MSKFNKLSRAEMKGVLGGLVYVGGRRCLDGLMCGYYESVDLYVSGSCTTNSNNKCVCGSTNSSVLCSGCVK